MGQVRVLDPDTINKIAAGEVVGRPFSVVKELVENALDADARSIRVDIEEGGKSLIRVADNGLGMDKEDAELSLVRHATSKLSDIKDLFFLSTMGFRGEALASISSVSRFTLTTCQRGSATGTEIVAGGNSQFTSKQISATEGTTVVVRDLFYNVPARLKFLKSDKTEFLHILKFMQSMSLIYPNHVFTLTSDQKQVFQVSGNGRLEDIVSEVFSLDVATDMKPVQYESEGIILRGMISTPAQTRLDRDKQWFFVNRRVVHSDLLSRALRSATFSIFPQSRHPYVFLEVECDASEVDVNVHPAKLDVKFRAETAVYKALQKAVSAVFSQAMYAAAVPEYIREERPQNNREYFSEKMMPMEWSGMFGPVAQVADVQLVREASSALSPVPMMVADETVLQLQNTYLIFVHEHQLMVIDQHIAHERVLYEKLKEKSGKVMSQEMLIPETLFLDPSEEIVLQSVLPELTACGFRLEEFGKGSRLIRAVPSYLMGKPVKQILKDCLSEGDLQDTRNRYNQVLMTIACKAAVKAGDALSPRERSALIRDWLRTPNALSCPHGRPIAKGFRPDEIAPWFRRNE